jgi:hypothetical protein
MAVACVVTAIAALQHALQLFRAQSGLRLPPQVPFLCYCTSLLSIPGREILPLNFMIGPKSAAKLGR